MINYIFSRENYKIYIIYDIYTYGYNNISLDILSALAILSAITVIISKNPIVSILFLIALFFCISGYLTSSGNNYLGLSYLLVYVGAVSILFLFILMLINIRISELVTDNSNSIPLAVFIGIYFLFTIIKTLPVKSKFFKMRYFDSTFLKKSNYNIWYDNDNDNQKNKNDIYKSETETETESLTSFDIINEKDNNINYENIISNNNHDFEEIEKKYINVENEMFYPIISTEQDDIKYTSSNGWDNNLYEDDHISSIGNIMYTGYPIWLLLTSIILLLSMVGAIVITMKKKN